MAKVGVSILDANFNNLQKEVDKVSNADFLHFDVMDGHFVPNISFGAKIVKDIETKLKKDVHLMIENPEKHVDSFIEAGADLITVHLEACQDLDNLINHIKKKGVKVGISINPETRPYWLRYYADKIDLILVMSVNPGFGGQTFIYNTLEKIEEIREWSKIDIAVDGGINDKTGKLCVLAGANILASGSFIFKHNSPREAVEILKKL